MEHLQNRLQKKTMINRLFYLILSLLIISAHAYVYQCTHCSMILDWWKSFGNSSDLIFLPFLFILLLFVHIFLTFIIKKEKKSYVVWIEYFIIVYILFSVAYWLFVLSIFEFSFWQYLIYCFVYIMYLVFLYRIKIVYS